MSHHLGHLIKVFLLYTFVDNLLLIFHILLNLALVGLVLFHARANLRAGQELFLGFVDRQFSDFCDGSEVIFRLLESYVRANLRCRGRLEVFDGGSSVWRSTVQHGGDRAGGATGQT